ncbi:exported hypothetical protein [Candidatus Sulfopaludibacter sp. SbA4]|nr:exported hypothetical protein [Candidatus Sulfopaludibacter sp. SbA4]
MDRIMTLLFTLLPMAGMAVPAKKKKKDHTKPLNGDSDVIVQDTGSMLTKTGKALPAGTDVHHKGVGKSGGQIGDIVPGQYRDATCTVDLTGAATWTIEFSDSESDFDATLKFDGTSIIVDFGLTSGKAETDDDLEAEGVTFDSIDLITYDSNGDQVIELTNTIDPKAGFKIHAK